MILRYLVDSDWVIHWTRRERGRLRRTVADFDLLIGATALRHDLTLLTNNRRHFELNTGLRIESC